MNIIASILCLVGGFGLGYLIGNAKLNKNSKHQSENRNVIENEQKEKKCYYGIQCPKWPGSNSIEDCQRCELWR